MQRHKLIHRIQEILIKQKKTLSVAESCTGGALSAAFTQQAGCSSYYLGGVIAYSNLMKINLLSVDEKDLEVFGAVSERVVLEMAEGVLKLTESDYSVAVSGIAGPDGGTPSKPVGTVWGAIGRREGESKAWLMNLSGTRDEIIQQAVNELLSVLVSILTKN